MFIKSDQRPHVFGPRFESFIKKRMLQYVLVLDHLDVRASVVCDVV